MPIIATAGHVDHGKSTLVMALTGRDPDRWTEEKERGLTIDLGFAWTRLGNHDVGLVDVPGHERFIKNMLAGIGGLDVALFVVAADEGWMPQSEEHLGVLDALEVHTGVIALTRCDLVDEDLLELAIAETEERVAGTSLRSWPVLPVSAPNGEGIAELRTALTHALDTAGAPSSIGRPRLWVDRAFTIEGAGLVVTGTLVDGVLVSGDRIEMWPGPTEARIRSIQAHEASLDEVGPGSRVALNITGIDKHDIGRGAMVCTPATFRVTSRLHAALRPVRSVDHAIANRGAYHLHAGSGHWPASLQLVGDLGEGTHAIVSLAEPVPLRMGDRFILREVGKRAVVGGGLVLDPHPPRGAPSTESARLLADAIQSDDPGNYDRTAMAAALLAHRSVENATHIDLDTGGGTAPDSVQLGRAVATRAWTDHRLGALRTLVATFHSENPMRPGMPKATLVSQFGYDASVVDGLIGIPTSGLEESGPVVRLAGHQVERTAAHKAAWDEAQSVLRGAGFAVPRTSSLNLDPELFHALVRSEELISVGEDLAYLPEQIDAITDGLRRLGDGFTVAQFRDAFEISRRHAVPLLEWLDKQGWTLRRGDTRTLRTKPTN